MKINFQELEHPKCTYVLTYFVKSICSSNAYPLAYLNSCVVEFIQWYIQKTFGLLSLPDLIIPHIYLMIGRQSFFRELQMFFCPPFVYLWYMHTYSLSSLIVRLLAVSKTPARTLKCHETKMFIFTLINIYILHTYIQLKVFIYLQSVSHKHFQANCHYM